MAGAHLHVCPIRRAVILNGVAIRTGAALLIGASVLTIGNGRWREMGEGGRRETGECERWEMVGEGGRRWETGESRRCEAARWFQVPDVVVRSCGGDGSDM